MRQSRPRGKLPASHGRSGQGSRYRIRWIAFALGGLPLIVPCPAGAETVISLSFDDGTQSQYQARSMLIERGLRATFFINSGRIGMSGYMTLGQLQELQSDGNEIGGHTIDHLDLTTLGAADAERQVCEDRAALINHGFDPVSFAYPFGAYNSSVQSIVSACGYATARTVGGIGCSGCPAAETIPPDDPLATRTPESVKSNTSLATLQGYVTAAEASGGGWVQLVFHHVCDGSSCPTYSVISSTLAAFLDWLVPREAMGTVVRTIREAAGGGEPGPDVTPPSSHIACSPRGCSEWSNASTMVTLSAVDSGSGVAEMRFTTDGSEPTETNGVVCPDNPFSFLVESTTEVKYRAWDLAGNVEATKSQLIRIDTTAPAVFLTSPPEGSSFRTGSAITLRANAFDDVGVAEVRFYDETIGLIGVDASPPYELLWKTGRSRAWRGERTLHAKAADLAGNLAQSSPVTITLQ